MIAPNVYRVTAFSPIKAGPASLLATILRVEVDQPIEWVRRNADEIAAKAVQRPVVALWVEEAAS